MQEILIVLCGVAGVAAAALIRRGRRAAGSALRSERNVLKRTVSLLERDPAYASERQELLPGYQARLKEVEQAIAGGDRTPDPDTATPREEQDTMVDAPGHAVPDGDAGGAGEPGAESVAPDSVTQSGVATVPDIPEPSGARGESGADEVRAAAPDTQIEDTAVPDVPEPPGGEPDTKAPPSAYSTPDTPETEPEAGDTKVPQAAAPAGPHADTIPQPGDASAAGGVENEAGHNAPGKGPDSTADVEHPPDTPAAAPPKTSGGETPIQVGAGTGTSGDAPPAMEPKDIHGDAPGRPGAGRAEGGGPAPPDPDGDDSEDLEKIKADIIKTLNRLQRAEDD
ncbi:MAG: hypothetical protein IS632_00225 [Thaumarchaeota archaeon]|nr:hypothetical protein [Nitrososphaerota archaeon]